jgi:cytidylate kinase
MIRTSEVSRWVSLVAANEEVRTRMVEQQKAIAGYQDVVMDGRDITHCVLPDADFKFYLTASIQERTRRRMRELKEQGYKVEADKLQQEIEYRDRQDMERKMGALTVVPDAIVIDSSGLSAGQVVERVLAIIREGSRAL